MSLVEPLDELARQIPGSRWNDPLHDAFMFTCRCGKNALARMDGGKLSLQCSGGCRPDDIISAAFNPPASQAVDNDDDDFDPSVARTATAAQLGPSTDQPHNGRPNTQHKVDADTTNGPRKNFGPRGRAALIYAERFRFPVFLVWWIRDDGTCACGGIPGCSPGKHPITEHGLKDATRDPQIIRRWWGRWPEANVAIATGNGLFVLDDDPRHGGDLTLEALEVTHGRLPDTPTVLTGGAGFHHFLRSPDGVEIRNNVGALGPGLDIRGDGGYVIAPPSNHASGRTYAWECSLRVDELPIAPAPQWLLGLIAQASTSNNGKRFETPPKIPEGQRNASLFGLGRALHARKLNYEEILAALRAVNLARCQPPLDDAEVEKTAHNAATEPDRPDFKTSNDSNGTEGQQDADAEWSEPIPLDIPLLPTVPADTFPPAIANMTEETAAATETPCELAFGMALGVLAAACQRKFEVRVKPGYIEPLSLWPIAPLNSGERKTAVLRRMTLPLTEWERAQASKMKAEIAKAMSERETALAQIQAMRTKAARLEPGSADFAHASEEIAELEVNLKEVPRAPRIWAQDVTPEKLGALMADHGEQMTIVSDEGGIIEIMAGRYSRGIPNLDIFLQGHAGAPHRVDRANRPPVLMQHPALSMALSPQPEVLHGLAANRDFRGRGLLARFVYLFGVSTLGYRTGEPPCVGESAAPAYEACVQRLLSIKPPESDALIIELSDEARAEWHAYFAAVEKDLRPGGRFEHMRDWAGKLPGMAARVAGVLHCAEHAFDADLTTSKLSLDTMRRALAFAAVCEYHALAAYDLMGADVALEAARKLWAWIERQRKVEFTFRAAFQALRGSFPRAADLEPAFGVLVERAHIASKQTAPRAGRPTRVYQVNPALTERWAKEGAQWTGERRAI